MRSRRRRSRISTGRKYPAKLAGRLYPRGIPIYPESELAKLIGKLSVDEVVFSYSDVSHNYVMDKASLVMALGADFKVLGGTADDAPRRRCR